MLSVSRPFVIRRNKVCAKMYQHFFFLHDRKIALFTIQRKKSPQCIKLTYIWLHLTYSVVGHLHLINYSLTKLLLEVLRSVMTKDY